MNQSNQLTINEQIKEIKKSIIYLTALNDHEALLSGLSNPLLTAQ